VSESQAIPEYLYTYSEHTTSANDTLQRWISAVVTPAIQRYRVTAIDFGNAIDGITIAASTPPGSTIDADLYDPLSRTHDLDKWVYDVGKAFQACEDQQIYMRNHGHITATDYSPTTLATVDDGALDSALGKIEGDAQALSASANDGKWWADYANATGIDAAVLREIAQHMDDPDWTAAFFNALSPDQFRAFFDALFSSESAMGEISLNTDGQKVIEALITAYHGGGLSKQVTDELFALLDPGSHQADGRYDIFRQAFMQELAKDPQAARNFINSLTDQQIATLAQNDPNPLSVSGSPQDDFIKVAAAALLGADPATATAIYHRVSNVLLHAPNLPANLQSDIASFISNYAADIIGPPPAPLPPNATLQQMTAWEDAVGKWGASIGNQTYKLMQPWIDRVKAIGDEQAAAQWRASLAFGLVTTIIGAPLSTGASLATGVIETLVPSLVGTSNPDQPMSADDMGKALLRLAEARTILELNARGEIDPSIDPSNMAYVLDHADEYHLKNNPESLVAVLGVVDHNYLFPQT